MKGVTGRRGRDALRDFGYPHNGTETSNLGCGFREVPKAVQEGPAETIQMGFTVTARLSEGRVLQRSSNPYEIGRKIPYKYL